MARAKYEDYYHCSEHGWILQGDCVEGNIGMLCPICLGNGRKKRVRTRPRHSNSAGEYIKNLKLKMTVDV